MLLNKIYVAGCGGALGIDLYDAFNNHFTIIAQDTNINEPWLSYGDVANNNIIDIIISYKPDLIINLAAITDLEYCETNENKAYLVNTIGAENLAIAANKLNIPYIFVSTGGIFDGKKIFYNDFDKPNPVNVYGKSKFYAEEIIKNNLKKYYIFRAGWMVGGLQKDKKFVKKIYDKIKNGEKELSIINDKYGSFTYTKDFINNLLYVLTIKHIPYGIYNMVSPLPKNGKNLSRYDIAIKIVEYLKLKDKIKINKINSDNPNIRSNYFIERPNSEQLQCLKLSLRNAYIMNEWESSLYEYLNGLTKICPII